MKAHLMHEDRDFDSAQELPRHAPSLMQDLELGTLIGAMANNDKFLFDVAQRAIFSGLSNDIDTILYRQAVLNDCLKNPAVVRAIYDLAVEVLEAKRQQWVGIFSNYPAAVLSGAVSLLELFSAILVKLKRVAQEHGGQFDSKAFRSLFAVLERELSDDYLANLQEILKQLKFPRGALVSAELAAGNEGKNYVLRKPRQQGWWQRLIWRGPSTLTYRIAERDQAGGRFLSELRDRGIHLAANALAQASDHILSFFQMLQAELAFYIGCINLHDRLAAKGESVCFPRPLPAGQRGLRYRGLYDVSLSLHLNGNVVGNEGEADGKSLIVITGANRGGKSSFLRGFGLAQLMMHCGMFVGAESFDGELCRGLFTHFKREEDAKMKSGKFDEEIARMSDIADSLSPNSLLLFNESFAATNEREGSEIAMQIVSALVEKRVKIVFVTHMFEFAHRCFEEKRQEARFLRAERLDDGTRTFKVVEGEPLETSYGKDLYRKIFLSEIDAA